MGVTKTYDPGKLVVSFRGRLISGFGDGSMIKITRDEDAYTKIVGGDGEVARVRSRNKSGSVELTLMQTSASNDDLSSAAALDELSGTGIGPLMVKDLLGTTVAAGANAWIRKLPDAEYNKDGADRVWIIDVEQLDLFVGGQVV